MNVSGIATRYITFLNARNRSGAGGFVLKMFPKKNVIEPKPLPWKTRNASPAKNGSKAAATSTNCDVAGRSKTPTKPWSRGAWPEEALAHKTRICALSKPANESFATNPTYGMSMRPSTTTRKTTNTSSHRNGKAARRSMASRALRAIAMRFMFGKIFGKVRHRQDVDPSRWHIIDFIVPRDNLPKRNRTCVL